MEKSTLLACQCKPTAWLQCSCSACPANRRAWRWRAGGLPLIAQDSRTGSFSREDCLLRKLNPQALSSKYVPWSRDPTCGLIGMVLGLDNLCKGHRWSRCHDPQSSDPRRVRQEAIRDGRKAQPRSVFAFRPSLAFWMVCASNQDCPEQAWGSRSSCRRAFCCGRLVCYLRACLRILKTESCEVV